MRYTFVKQHDATDCAAACLAMVCLHYKKETTITRLRDLMGTDLKGTNLVGLSKCAKELGFMTQAVKVDEEGFKSKYTLPAIANIVTKEGMTHFVVVYKVKKRYVIVGDPASDLEKVPMDEFLEQFTGNMLILMPTDSFEAGSDGTKSVFKRYIKLLWPQKKLFVFSVLASIILTVLGIASSMFNKILMDEILPYKLEDTLLMVLIIFALVSVTKVVIGFVRSVIMVYLSMKIDIPLMLGYFGHIYKLPMKFFASRKTGDITTRFSDAFTIKNIFTNIALTLIMDIIMTVATGVILFNMNINMFTVIAVMTIISVLLVFIFRQPYKNINEEQMRQASILNSQIIEGLRAVETIKGNAVEDIELDNIEREYIRSVRIGLKENMLSNIQNAISSVVSTVGNLVLTYIGVKMVINGDITLGSMMAFTTLSGYFMSPVSRLVGLQLQIQEANISMNRISEILDYETEQESMDGRKYRELESVDEDIVFEHVTFRYGNRRPVLDDVSFRIPKGKKVAIVGSSGSGKTTIAKLLLKYYQPEKGCITVGDSNIEDFSNESLRKAISYMPQNIELFSKNIFDNIRIGKYDATYDEVVEAAKMARADEFISKLPLQYLTYLEEAANGLSGGEKQRIALARALIKKNEFYILDESTSNLDFSTENVIFDTIYNKLADKSMLIIAHRLATIKNCDYIIVMDEGKIVQEGTHESLVSTEGIYQDMWNLQQGNVTMDIEEISEVEKEAENLVQAETIVTEIEIQEKNSRGFVDVDKYSNDTYNKEIYAEDIYGKGRMQNMYDEYIDFGYMHNANVERVLETDDVFNIRFNDI